MRRSGIVIFLLCLFVLWLVLVVYLAGLPPEPRGLPRINIGIVPLIEPAGPGSFSLGETNQKILDFRIDLPNESAEKEIYYVLGWGVDGQGNSASWIYGVRHKQGTALLMYDRAGWRIIPWNGKLPDQQLDLAALYPLDKLFSYYEDLFMQPAITDRQVELINGTYRISLADSAATRTLIFNATTGALIEPHEE